MLEMFPDSDAAAQAAADGVAEALSAAIATRGKATLVATGGRSPGPVYDRLRAAKLDWSRVSVTLSDERFVPPSSPDSNAGLLQRRLFSGPPAAAAFVPLWSDVATSDLAAAAADPAVAALAPFDVVMLGMGEDGHIASLLPGAAFLPAAMDLSRPAAAMGVPAGVGSPPMPRITLTLKALLESRAIFLLIAGEVKRDVVARAAAGADLPVRGILAQDRVPVRVLWAPSHGQ